MPTIIKENYLKALLFLNQQSDAITITQLGEVMGVSKPTVNDMVKKLKSAGWVEHEKYQPIHLTKEGQMKAALVVRKHRLSEMFLCEIMGFGWEEVHEIAEQLEHIRSEQFFDRMDELLGFPKVDPHGSPIPDRNGHLEHPHYPLLSQIMLGKVVVKGLAESSTSFLKFLNNKNIRLGTILTITGKEDFDGSMVVHYNEHQQETLSASVTERLLVEVVNGAS
ncbi:MAG: metal-dependent transcriptional regulator [Flavobacteriales bacterium]|nr:metal-dependent transcriptional regulator [Flavobacteriales bacterium]